MQIYVDTTILAKQKKAQKKKHTKVSASLSVVLLWVIFSPRQVYINFLLQAYVGKIGNKPVT